ncbi:MAG: hypothetical protein FWC50_14940 [Planctomycetaceae bacterium]|nr:hypothetical protein [Planctomycetaceae bacterium]
MAKKVSFLVLLFALILVTSQGRASAQLFRFMQDRDKRDEREGARSVLPNMPAGTSFIAADHFNSAPTVSDEVRNEIAGRSRVRAVPDFLGKSEQYQRLSETSLPKTYRTNRSVESGSRVIPPLQLFFYDRYDAQNAQAVHVTDAGQAEVLPR